MHLYLREMQHRRKWNDVKDDLKVGDLVLMMDEQLPRGQWPLGLVLEVKRHRDGHVRSARLKARGSTYVRPITKVVRLELV